MFHCNVEKKLEANAELQFLPSCFYKDAQQGMLGRSSHISLKQRHFQLDIYNYSM